MLKTYLYFPDQLNEDIVSLIKISNESKAKYIREAVEERVKKDKRKLKKSSAQSLLDLAEIGKRYNIKGPKDLSTNHDKYLWGIE